MECAGHRDRRRLRWLLGLFFLALALPTALLIHQASVQLKWESFYQQRTLAAELALRIDARINQIVDDEEARSASDYHFLVVAGDPAANYVQRSVLSSHHVRTSVPGLVGYFQLDPNGAFTTPLLPPTRAEAAAFGLSGTELGRRLSVQAEVRRLLGSNALLGTQTDDWGGLEQMHRLKVPPSGSTPASQGWTGTTVAEQSHESIQRSAGLSQPDIAPKWSFEQLATRRAGASGGASPSPEGMIGGLDRLQLRSKFSAGAVPDPAPTHPAVERFGRKRGTSRKEKVVLLEMRQQRMIDSGGLVLPQPGTRQVAVFDAEVRPLEFTQLTTGHFLLFRQVLGHGGRYVQGMLIDPDRFVISIIESAFDGTPLSRISHLVVAWETNILADFGVARKGWRRDLLYRTHLSPPLDNMELIFTSDRLPAGPGAALIAWLSGILTVVLCGGFSLMYRLGVRQIAVSHQQQDFVAAVSHELKTPLTSIRMYAEMLREGWVSEGKKSACYAFIYSESERLSRLIANVLNFSRMTRHGFDLALRPMRVASLSDALLPNIRSQVASAGFELQWFCDPHAADGLINIDEDSITQMVINLIDNALKFSAKSPQRMIEAGWRASRDGGILFSVRDYGPGIPRDRRNSIFRPFYRLDNELTRNTAGTGIGLALVNRLAKAMDAQVDVVEREPGVEFRVRFPRLIESEDCGTRRLK